MNKELELKGLFWEYTKYTKPIEGFEAAERRVRNQIYKIIENDAFLITHAPQTVRR